MRYEQFLATVQRRGGYGSEVHARNVSTAVLTLLAYHLPPATANDVLAALPHQARDIMRGARPEPWLSVEQFLHQIPIHIRDGSPDTARHDAAAVLSTVADALPAAERERLRRLLPLGFGPLFDPPDRAAG